MEVGQDIITPLGYGEIVELLSHNQVLVEYPNRTRKVYQQENKNIKVVRI